MNVEALKAELVKSRQSHKHHSSSEQQEFTVVFSPSTKLTCSILSARNQSYPIIFGRADTKGALEATRIIATPEGNPTGIAAFGFPSDTDAQIAVHFYMSGVADGDVVELQKVDGKRPCEVILFLWLDGTPHQVHKTFLADNDEHTFKLKLPVLQKAG